MFVWPVVVAGAGPAGLVAAITLARAGIRILVLNRRSSVFSHPRATVISLRSMELFRSWGLQDEILAGGDDVEWRMLVTSTLSESAAGELIEVGYPGRSESARLSPTRPAAVPQDHLETVLINYLLRLRPARVLYFDRKTGSSRDMRSLCSFSQSPRCLSVAWTRFSRSPFHS